VTLLRDEAVRYNVLVRTELAADLPRIVGDRLQLQQVAMNLIVNGIEAMRDVDGIREIVIKSRRAEDEQILVSVSDTGIGFPLQLAEQIFDPFFTTKPQGTGMGLRMHHADWLVSYQLSPQHRRQSTSPPDSGAVVPVSPIPPKLGLYRLPFCLDSPDGSASP
jgi:C4-dicarboxylate-specific signal transduction histidine kinase